MRYVAEFITTISLRVEVEADDEDAAAELAWQPAQDYLDTLLGDGQHVISVDASLDGIGADEVRAAAGGEDTPGADRG